MSEQSSMHFYLNWAKERLDEMDATLASFEAAADKVKAESKSKADQIIADLKKRRDEFRARMKAEAQAGEATLRATKAQLEADWKGFEAQVTAYFETIGKQIEQQQATFQDVAAAQIKAWQQAADKLRDEASKMAAAKRADIDAALTQMKADAKEAEERLEKLRQAGSESWTALSAALEDSRKSFDRANQAAGDAFKRAMPPAA
jgi:hypothetical protein